MDTITGIKDLDAYLVSFFDQNTVYNYSILSKETNRIVSNHILFKTLKEYHETHQMCDDVFRWAIRNDKPYILDWYDRLDYPSQPSSNKSNKFENIFAIVNIAIIYGSTKILDWFYQRGMFDYSLVSLSQAVIDGTIESIDWFYDHGLEKTYLDKLLSEHMKITHWNQRIHNHTKLLQVLKWFHKKNYSIELDIQLLSTIQDGTVELISWLLENKLVDKSIFNTNRHILSSEMKKIPVEKQLAVLTFLKDMDYQFKEWDITSLLLLGCPIDVFEWCKANIPYIRLIDVFRLAALANKVSIMKWTGIDADHPDFGLLNHNNILEEAIKHHRMDVVKWYFENITVSKKILKSLYEEFRSTKMALEEFIQIEQYFEKYEYLYEPFLEKMVENAFDDGNLAIVEYLIPKLQTGSTIRIDNRSITNNIENGNIGVLKWLKKHLYKNDGPVQILYEDGHHMTYSGEKYFTYAIDMAANHGHLETIKWVKYFMPHKFNYNLAINNAARKCYFDILDWFDKTFCHTKFKYTTSPLDYCCSDKKIQLFKWFHSSEHPLKYTNRLIEDSVYEKNINVLQWLKNNQCPMIFIPQSIYLACISFSEVLQWLKDNGVIKIIGREMISNRVIEIFGREMMGNLLVFTIELAQPFSVSNKSNVKYETISSPLSHSQFFKIVNSNLITGHDAKIIKINFNCDKIYDISTTKGMLSDGLYDIYCSLHWFEHCYKLQQQK